MPRPYSLPFTPSDEANRLLASDGLALLIGMLLDQQMPMERAFQGPQLLKERLGGELTAEGVVGRPPEELDAIFRGPPAIHRFPSAMARRTQELCEVIVEEYGGRAERIWETAADAHQLLARLEALPGFGKAKARIFVGVVAKRLGVELDGWDEVAADWPSIADVTRFEDVAVQREKKRQMKSARKS